MKWRNSLVPLLVGRIIHCTRAENWLAAGNQQLASGSLDQALESFNQHILSHPADYVAVFKRGTTLVSLGRDNAALADLDRVLELNPGFEGALLLRTRVYLRMGRLARASSDAQQVSDSVQRQNLLAAIDKHKTQVDRVRSSCNLTDLDFDHVPASSDLSSTCLDHVTSLIQMSPKHAPLRLLRAQAHLAAADINSALHDLDHAENLVPSDPEPFAKAAVLVYYARHDYARAMAHLARCLRYDPDSLRCKAVHTAIKRLERGLKDVRAMTKKAASQHKFWKQFKANYGGKEALGSLESQIATALKEIGLNPASSSPWDTLQHSRLYQLVLETLCEADYNTRDWDEGALVCELALKLDPAHIPGVLLKAQIALDKGDHELALQILQSIPAERQPENDGRVSRLYREIQAAIRRAKTKDYYAILGVPRTASAQDIRRGFRAKTREFHPDKYRGSMDATQVERKMADINEANEVLSSPELRQRYDEGNDPMGSSPHAHAHAHPFHESPFGDFRQQGFQFHFDSDSDFHFHF